MSTCHGAPPFQSSLAAHSPFARVLPPLPRRSLGTPCTLVSPCCGLPRYYGGSASALAFSRPARCSLLVAARALPAPPEGFFLEVLQRICRFLHRSEWFRRELGRRAGLSPAGKVRLGKVHTTTTSSERCVPSGPEGTIGSSAAPMRAPAGWRLLGPGALLMGVFGEAAANPWRGYCASVYRAPVVVAPPVYWAPAYVPAPPVVAYQAPAYRPADRPVVW